jgi:4-amino-4-deoxy-L-arabinose transferase-like glycosyltransferase
MFWTHYIIGFLLALCMGGWWYVALVFTKGWTEFYALFQFEVGQRLAGAVHRESMDYYLIHILLVTLPWTVGVPGAILSALRTLNIVKAEDETLNDRADRFLLAWVLGIVFFFSIPGAKLITYVLPAMPALALLVARLFERLSSEMEVVSRSVKAVTWSLAAAFSVLLLSTPLLQQYFPKGIQVFVADLPMPITIMVGAFGISVGLAWVLAAKRLGTASALVSACAAVIFLALTIPPGIKNFLVPRSTREICAIVKPQIADCERVACLGDEIESLIFYLEVPVHETRRRRVAKRQATHAGQADMAAIQDEPFDAVIKEELAKDMKVALFIPDRFYAPVLGMKTLEFRALSNEAIAKSLPANSKFIARSRNLIVIRNLR